MVCNSTSVASLLSSQWKVVVRWYENPPSKMSSTTTLNPSSIPPTSITPPSTSSSSSPPPSNHNKKKGIPTWYSAWLWNNSISTTGNCFTYRCRSNCSLIFVRSSPTDMFSEYIVWISGAYIGTQSASIRTQSAAPPVLPSFSIPGPTQFQSTQSTTQPVRSIPVIHRGDQGGRHTERIHSR